MAAPITVRRFTVDEYHRMGQVGIFGEDDRVELIDGQVVEMTPIGARHVACVVRLTDLLAPLTGRGLSLSVQSPLVLGERSEPQPDLVVLRHRPGGSTERLPGHEDARGVKVPLYAEAGIPEVWLVDLHGRRIAVHRKPGPEGFADVAMRSPGDTLTATAIPDLGLHVEEVLGG